MAQIIATEKSSIINKCVLTDCVAFDSWPVEGIKKLIQLSRSEEALDILSDEVINDTYYIAYIRLILHIDFSSVKFTFCDNV
ncbi:hypothetical protein [Clostridium oryzae]|uniref:Uncharacterized protein n=1 Tax=Clostridium oryzae TaxID=1450648 RepID=A0A1V4IJV8_9CLOT|nr:hypothetical protein [Clostridium oryzae]OPJ60206.1 hypothetical protein CLORY_29270 [Clostridium oryzae]